MDFQMKEIRTKKGISREEIASSIGVSIHTIRSWELKKSRPNLDLACDVADVLDCTLDELAGRERPPKDYSDSRQASLNKSYSVLSEDGKDVAVASIEAMAEVYIKRNQPIVPVA